MIYPSYGNGVLRALLKGALSDFGPPISSILLLADEAAWPICEQAVEEALEQLGTPTHRLLWAADESRKTMAQAEAVASYFVTEGCDRDSLLLAVGGGVTTDLGGFTASILLRGIRWGAVPTTLLAMADAAIGGKTAVNLPEGKNLLGRFHHPLFVLCDVATLATLPPREWNSGLGEVLKTAFLSGEEAWRRLEDASPEELRQPGELSLEIAADCGRTKMRVVEEDPEEQGIRKLLNFGHTFGHALETAAEGRLGHGEAVALGIRCAMRMAEELDIAEPGVAPRVRGLAAKLQLPSEFPGKLPSPGELQTLMMRDKKAHKGSLDLVLPVEPGRCLLLKGVDPKVAAQVIHREL